MAELQVARFTGLARPPTSPRSEPSGGRNGSKPTSRASAICWSPQPSASARRSRRHSRRPRAASTPTSTRPTNRASPGWRPSCSRRSGSSPPAPGGAGGQVLGYLGAARARAVRHRGAAKRPGAMLFVVPNIAEFERDWSLPRPISGRGWRCTRSPTDSSSRRRGRTPTSRELLDDFLSTLEFDVGGIQERLGRTRPLRPRGHATGDGVGEGLFGTVLDAEQRIKLDRIQAFMAAAEGYGDHVTRALGRRAAPVVRPDRGGHAPLPRGRAGRPGVRAPAGDRDEARAVPAGPAFCDTVVELTDEATLASMWSSPRRSPPCPRSRSPASGSPGRPEPEASARNAQPSTETRYPSRPMAVGELVAATVADQRVFDAYGENAPAGIYLLNQPGRALPFAIFRAWKVPTGIVTEEVRFIGPSGRMVCALGAGAAPNGRARWT